MNSVSLGKWINQAGTYMPWGLTKTWEISRSFSEPSVFISPHSPQRCFDMISTEIYRRSVRTSLTDLSPMVLNHIEVFSLMHPSIGGAMTNDLECICENSFFREACVALSKMAKSGRQ